MSKRTDQLREENNRREKSLGAESNAVLTDIVVYLRTSRLGGYDQELVRRDIAQMLLEGEKRGQTAREVIGGDYKKFCDDIISEFPQQAVSVRALSALRTFFLCAAVLLTIKAASGALSGLLNGGRWYYHAGRRSGVWARPARRFGHLRLHIKKELRLRRAGQLEILLGPVCGRVCHHMRVCVRPLSPVRDAPGPVRAAADIVLRGI